MMSTFEFRVGGGGGLEAGGEGGRGGEFAAGYVGDGGGDGVVAFVAVAAGMAGGLVDGVG